MTINIAIVDDNKSFNEVLGLLLSQISSENISLSIDTFISPMDYKESDKEYHIVILDCIFKGYPDAVNGIKLAEHTKSKNRSTKVILTSEFADSQFLPIVMMKSNSVDFYSDKNLSENKILEKLKEYIEEIFSSTKSKIKDLKLKLHIYKVGKELFSLSEINYAKTESREKHTILVNTSQGDIVLSMTLNQFVNNINKAIVDSGIDMSHKKTKQDLYINHLNVKNMENDVVSFVDGNSLVIN
ncbi:MAG TPA: hypothetical protein DEP20_00345 [Fusobacteria bacterium]|nr:hypothetical protein [Fusobacteriota bacterium]|tara:strand:- start:3484 stop:4209 length:726 start_codon:yes stop_codon:yes gene_type:complete